MEIELTEHDWLQIEMAARGCISGRLSEWPDLITAIRKVHALRAIPCAECRKLREACADAREKGGAE